MPLHSGATSSGVVRCVRSVFAAKEMDLAGSRAVVQGFGKVGGPLVFLLASAGMRVVAVADVAGAVHNPGGLDASALSDHVARTGSVVGFEGARPSTPRRSGVSTPSSWSLPPWRAPSTLPAATSMKASVVVEAANGPTTPEADLILASRQITVVPDILANAGGVTASYFEWAQSRQGYPWDEELVATRLARTIDDAFLEPSGTRPKRWTSPCAGPPAWSPSTVWPPAHFGPRPVSIPTVTSPGRSTPGGGGSRSRWSCPFRGRGERSCRA